MDSDLYDNTETIRMVTPIKLLSGPFADESEPAMPTSPPPSQAPSSAPGPGTGPGNVIDQVRELLYGDAMRGHGRRVEDLGGAMRDLEHRVMQRLDEMQNAIDALARSMRVEQTNAVRSIGLTLAEMGRQIAATGDMRGERAGSDASA